MSALRYKTIEGKFLVSQLADETVLMDAASGDYMGLNPVGTVVWSLLEEEQTMNTMIAKLLDRYEVSAEQCQQELTTFLQELDKRKMITVA